MFSTVGCHNYYMAAPIYNSYDTGKAIDSLRLQNRYFILRNGYHAFHMKDIFLGNDNEILKATLEKLPSGQQMCL